MAKLVYKIFISLLLITPSSYGAIKSISKINLEIQRSKTEIDLHQRNLKKLKSEILALRGDVSGETAKFTKIVSMKTNLKSEINEKKKVLKDEQKALQEEILVIKKIFAGIILTEDTENEVDYRFLTLKSLKNKESLLKKRKENIVQMLASLEGMHNSLSEYDFIETDLINNIENMHKREKALSHQVTLVDQTISENKSGLKKLDKQRKSLIKIERRKKEQKRIAQIKIKKEKEEQARVKSMELSEVKKLDFKKEYFSLPLGNFKKIKKDKSGGLSLFVNSSQDILAPSKGEILYTGKLSTYGNVIVIKHAEGYQSVILGEIISDVTKTEKVKQGQVIGRIIENNGDEKRLYYELRNKKKKVSYANLFNGVAI